MNSLMVGEPGDKGGTCYSENLTLVDLVSVLRQGEFLPAVFQVRV